MSTTITAECRPNLRVCNFFIHSSAMTFVDASLEVRENAIVVCSKAPSLLLDVRLPSNVTLLPGCVSGLVVTINSISFRGQIGNFTQLNVSAPHRPVYSPDFRSEDVIKLSCEFCLEPFSDSLNFSRILPLPSSEDVGEFFCHRHSEESFSLVPGILDFFYNFFFYKVNASCLNTVKNDTNSFNCPKCDTHLGEVQGKCVRLWSSVVKLVGPVVRNQTALDRFLESLKYFVKDLPVQMNKLVFTCSHSANDTSYTLVTVLDRNLNLLSNADVPFKEVCQLEYKIVMKILYSHFTEQSDETDEWMKSYNSSVVPIHPAVEGFFLSYLAAQSGNIPSDFQSVNGFKLSYIQ